MSWVCTSSSRRRMAWLTAGWDRCSTSAGPGEAPGLGEPDKHFEFSKVHALTPYTAPADNCS